MLTFKAIYSIFINKIANLQCTLHEKEEINYFSSSDFKGSLDTVKKRYISSPYFACFCDFSLLASGSGGPRSSFGFEEAFKEGNF